MLHSLAANNTIASVDRWFTIRGYYSLLRSGDGEV